MLASEVTRLPQNSNRRSSCAGHSYKRHPMPCWCGHLGHARTFIGPTARFAAVFLRSARKRGPGTLTAGNWPISALLEWRFSPVHRQFRAHSTRRDKAIIPAQTEAVAVAIEVPPIQYTGRHDACRSLYLALEGATSYWASTVANSSGHMSHHGARGTRWTVFAPDELARLASL